MNSKQINFFLDPAEISEINNFFLDLKCSFLKRESKNPDNIISYDILRNHEHIFQIYLTTDGNNEKIFYEHIESKNLYYIDILKSYCIEFSIGGFYPYSDKELHSSRLYYVLKYYEKGKLLQKDKEFIRWAENIINRFKKKFLTKSPTSSANFITRKFIIWEKENNAKISTDGTKFIIK